MKQFLGKVLKIEDNTLWFTPVSVDPINFVKSSFEGIQVFYNGKEVKRLLIEVNKNRDKRK